MPNENRIINTDHNNENNVFGYGRYCVSEQFFFAKIFNMDIHVIIREREGMQRYNGKEAQGEEGMKKKKNPKRDAPTIK